jgi:hypothetical protein
MNTLNHIIDQPLPLNQDFKSLKNEGLAHIQKVTGNEWTNLNASDPGITILDQLCYALTELGYCNDFSIKDILTNPDDKLIVKDQFYLPEEILTTSPVTINDYIKYIIDEISEVKNLIITPQQSAFDYIKGIYKTYLYIDPAITNPDAITAICRSVFYRLNKRRNLGEIFMMPFPLENLTYKLTGQIEITNEADVNSILTLVQNKIRNFVFPKVIQQDENQLIIDDEITDEVYNGPEMRHGWVSDNDLGTKQNLVRTRDLTTIIQTVAGVKFVANLEIQNTAHNDFVTSTENQLLCFDLGSLEIVCTKSNTTSNTALSSLNSGYKQLDADTSFGAAVNKKNDLPKGKYRDINSYYSIQNTFPEIYAVGANAINSNASDFQIAQSRQLKGYLTLFDQILANQFSQLANVHQLFSFKNGLCGAPSEMQSFYASKSQYEKNHTQYPVPFLTFSPTYFYQSLYNIPNIKPLLKNNNAFNFSLTAESRKTADDKSWEKFKQDPYNSYIRGLQEMVENETVNLDRRNQMLDHLLARHGESPLLINTIIEGSIYSGNGEKDKVIFKSLYLQNLGLLSYFRQKGYNYLGAKQIQQISINLPADAEQLLATINTVDFYLPSEKGLNADKYEGFENDFIFNSNKVDQIEKLKKQDFINYAALELQVNILLGLRMAYINYIQNILETLCDACKNTQLETEKCLDCNIRIESIKQCLWLLKERKGFVCIENNLLYPIDEVIIIKSLTDELCYETNTLLSYAETMALYVLLENAKNISITKNETTPEVLLMIIDDNTPFEVKETQRAMETNWIKMSHISEYCFAMQHTTISQTTQSIKTLTLIFPNYIPYFETVHFKDRLNLLLTNTLPVAVSYNCEFVDHETWHNLIPAYTNWHNSLIFNNSNHPESTPLAQATQALVDIMNQLNATKQ